MSRARADSSAGDSNEPRGRARSRTFSHEQDSGFGADIDLLNAELDGKSPEEIEALKKEAAKQAAATNAALNSGINTRALKIVSSLDAAVARPEEENGLNDAPANKTLEEEEDELRLAEMEKRKREAEKAGDSGGASGRGRAKKDQGDYDVQIKLLLLGDSGVGKTSLMSRFSEDKFNMSQLSTAGVDYKSSYMDMGGKRVKCQVWDTAGQQRFHVITHSYYKGVHGIILVYDVADPTEESFNNVRYWMENINKHASPGTCKILIGNKIDMKGKKIDRARGQAVADEFHMRFAETSAKDGHGVRDAFSSCAQDVLRKMLAAGEGSGGGASGSGGVSGKSDKGDKKDCTIM